LSQQQSLVQTGESSNANGWVNVDLGGLDHQRPRIDGDFNLLSQQSLVQTDANGWVMTDLKGMDHQRPRKD